MCTAFSRDATAFLVKLKDPVQTPTGTMSLKCRGSSSVSSERPQNTTNLLCILGKAGSLFSLWFPMQRMASSACGPQYDNPSNPLQVSLFQGWGIAAYAS